ncbi:MAG: MFS transporter [Burkholderiales bacterium]|nr:MFS transporter [Burkholderiales bacterium]
MTKNISGAARSLAGSPLRPGVVLACACVILTLSVGIRQTFGLFLQPMSVDFGWGRETFAFALAAQNLVWGVAQPFAGMIADKFGAGRVVIVGSLLYALGLLLMAYADTALGLDLSAGVLIGLGLSGTTFGVVMGVVGRAVSAEKRSMALGIAGAGGSFGQFIMLPYGQSLISTWGWQAALIGLAVSTLLIAPLAYGMRSNGGMKSRSGAKSNDSKNGEGPEIRDELEITDGLKSIGGPAAHSIQPAATQSMAAAVRQAAAHQGFWLLTLSFFVCGFQIVFILTHLPAFLLDRGMTPTVGVTALALIGFFNIVGSYGCGFLGGRYSKKRMLSVLYFARAIVITAFIALPVTPVTTYLFASVIGLLWLGTVPLTNGLVAQIFGVKYMSTLFGIVFLGHQLGGFIGAWYGGYVFDATGSYQTIWLIAIALSVLAGLVCWPIDERGVAPIYQEKPA